MKHKIKIKVPIEKRGFLGIKKAVMETRTVEVDNIIEQGMIKQNHTLFYLTLSQ